MIFFLFLLKTQIVAKAVLMSTHNLCFGAIGIPLHTPEWDMRGYTLDGLVFLMYRFQMNGVPNGDAVNLALQGLTVQGSNNNNDNKVVESNSERLPRGKVRKN